MKYLLVVLAIILVLVPTVVLAGDYYPDEDATFYAQVLDGAGSPVNNATVLLTLWDTDGNKELDGVSMDYITASEGLYEYDFTVPSELGVYVAEVTSSNPTCYGSTELHVIEEFTGNITVNATVEATIDPDSIWGANMSDYTDTATFGGFFNITIGGGDMTVLQLLFIILLCVLAVWQKTWLRVICSIAIITWGASSVSYDPRIGLPLMGIGLLLFILGITRMVEDHRQSQET